MKLAHATFLAVAAVTMLSGVGFSALAAAAVAAADVEEPLVIPEPLPSASANFVNAVGWRVQIEVIAGDRASAAFVRDLAANCERTLARIFPSAFPRPSDNTNAANAGNAANSRRLPPALVVDIFLLSRAEAPWAEPCRLLSGYHSERVLLAIKWTRETTLAETRAAVARAALARLILANANANAAPNTAPALTPESAFAAVPSWLVDALLLEVDVRNRPSLENIWLSEMRNAPTPALELVGTSAVPPRVSLWFSRHLRREFRRERVSESQFFRELPAGAKPAEILRRHFPAVAADADRRAVWWAAGLANLVREPSRGVQLMEESAAAFARETSFLFAPAGVDMRFPAAALPRLRELPAAQRETQIRLQRLQRNLPLVNPVWHNAFLSYGVFLERFPVADAAELERLWARAAADAAEAAQLQSAVSAALSAPSSRK